MTISEDREREREKERERERERADKTVRIVRVIVIINL